MDKSILGGLLVIVIVAAVAGILVFNNMNPKTTGFSNPIKDNQTVNNNTNINESNVTQSSSTLFALSSYSLINTQYAPGPTPSPSPDPLEHLISLFDAYLNSTFLKAGIPGAAVVIVKDDKVVYMNCLGVRDLASGEPVDPNTLFGIGSCTKQFSSTNIAQLVSAGLMNWNDPITKYYPDTNEFQLYSDYVTSNITIRDCLCHCSGYMGYSGDMNCMFFNFSYPYCLHQLRYMTDFVANYGEFRNSFQYHNILYSLPAYCAARVENTTWSDLIKEELLVPLGMTNTTVTRTDFMNSPDHATPYIELYNHTLVQYDTNIDPIGPAGIMACSISEMANWLKFQIADTGYYNGVQIVSKSALDETRTLQNNVTSEPWSFIGPKYGMGWFLGDTNRDNNIFHSGDSSAFHAMVNFYPVNGLGIAIFTNGGNYAHGLRTALNDKFNDLVRGNDTTDPWPDVKKNEDAKFKLVLGPPTPPFVDAQPLSTYVGIYNNAFYGNINITTENNSLMCYYGNNSEPFSLMHWNGDVFEEPVTNQAFNFTEISNNQSHKLILPFMVDYSTFNNSSETVKSVFNRTNSN